MEDKKIICKECGEEFIYTTIEQEKYKEKGFVNDPVRCKFCRDKRKMERNTNRKPIEPSRFSQNKDKIEENNS